MDIDTWKQRLSKASFNLQEVTQLMTAYQKYHEFLLSAEKETIRWFSHGHLSFYIIWCAFARCTYESIEDDVYQKERAAHNVLRYADDIRFKRCASSWAQSAHQGKAEYPSEILSLLELVRNKPTTKSDT